VRFVSFRVILMVWVSVVRVDVGEVLVRLYVGVIIMCSSRFVVSFRLC